METFFLIRHKMITFVHNYKVMKINLHKNSNMEQFKVIFSLIWEMSWFYSSMNQCISQSKSFSIHIFSSLTICNKISCINRCTRKLIKEIVLTYFWLMCLFYTKGFLVIIGGIKWEHWSEMVSYVLG